MSWPLQRQPGQNLATAEYFAEAAKHAWIYGVVVGAAHMSEERLARVNADTVDAWMDTCCARHPRASIGYAAAVLVEELSRMR